MTGPGGSNTQTRTNYMTVGAAGAGRAVHRQSDLGHLPADGELQQHVDRSITSYAWTFGDGGTSTAASPSHVYAAAGTYTVALTVTGPGGSNTQTRTNYVTVGDAGAGRAVHRQSDLGHLPADGELQQHVDRIDHQLRVDLRRRRHQHRGESEPRLRGGGHLHRRADGDRPGGSNTQTRTNYVTVSAPAPVAQFTGSPTSGTAR